MGIYSSNRLDPQRRKVGLCTLHHDFLDIWLVGVLSAMSLVDKPEYETLSNVWVDPTSSKAISANGDALRTRTRLHTALRYMCGRLRSA